MVRQQSYAPAYNNVQNYNPVQMTPTNVVPANTIVQTSAVSNSGIVQTNGMATSNGVTTAGMTSGTPGVAAAGSAQWKAEQSARMGSVAHLGGGFGGGSFEGNGYGATAQQAIQNACFWGQKTPIEIGVAPGANGYYATIFYR